MNKHHVTHSPSAFTCTWVFRCCRLPLPVSDSSMNQMVWGLDPGSRTTSALPLSRSAQQWIIFTTTKLDLFLNTFIGTPRERTHDGSDAMSSGCSRPPWSVLWSTAEIVPLVRLRPLLQSESQRMPCITGSCFSHQQNGLDGPMTPHYCSMFSTSCRLGWPAPGASVAPKHCWLTTKSSPSTEHRSKTHIEDVRHDAIILPFLDFSLYLYLNLSLKGPSALLLPAFNHWVVVPDKYLIPIKIPLIKHLPATCSQRLPSKPQPWGEHWDLLDYFSAGDWKQRWLLIVFPSCPWRVLHL